MYQNSLCLIATVVLSLTTTNVTTAQSYSANKVSSVCLIRHLDEIEIPAKRDGIIQKLHVRRGTSIQAGQLLAIIDGSDALADLAVAEAQYNRALTRASNKWPIQVANTNLQLTDTEAKLLQELGEDAAYFERYRTQNARAKSAAELNAAKATNHEDLLASRVASAELAVAKRNVSQRQIPSPVGGSVVEVHRDQGEWADRGDKIMTVVRLDKLQLEGFVNINDVPPHLITGARARATIQISGQNPVVLDGLKITHTSPTTELDGKYLVWTEIENKTHRDLQGDPQWLLRPGMSGTLEIIVSSPKRKIAQKSKPQKSQSTLARFLGR